MVRTIAVFLLLIFLLLGIPNVFAEVPSDVPQNHWAYEAVELLIKEGIIKGYPDGTFRGNQTLTRYELAMIIAKLLELIRTSNSKVEPQETKVKTETQTAQTKDTKVSIKRREIPPNAYTGLVVDARGFKVGRSISPKIHDAKGREIYGVSIFAKENHSLEEYITLGVVEYIRYDGTNLSEKIRNSRAGSKPLIVKAVGTQGEFNDNILVSEEDGNLILKEDEVSKFLEDMAVVIVY
ncbi:MAG: S-layer homology domain-containing protein [bacterium]|nr:S-layer homology domain-containing protein [bacterium]